MKYKINTPSKKTMLNEADQPAERVDRLVNQIFDSPTFWAGMEKYIPQIKNTNTEVRLGTIETVLKHKFPELKVFDNPEHKAITDAITDDWP